MTDANGIVTEYTYNDAGCVTRAVRKDGADVLSSFDVACDACGHLVREGDRTYTYGYLDKVLSVTENDRTITYAYHPDGQLASADYGRARTPASPHGDGQPSVETFAWDGLALIRRGDEQFVNEPHVGGGNPVCSSKGMTYFNDMLGTTVGAKSGNQYSAAALSAFGEDLAGNGKEDSTHSSFSIFHSPFFTGKPAVEGLGYAFLMRNYRAGLGKWQTADPMGYPDGWNQLAYCNNGVTSAVDLWGCEIVRSYYTDIIPGEDSDLSPLPEYLPREKLIPGDLVDFLCGRGYGKVDQENIELDDMWSFGDSVVSRRTDGDYLYVVTRTWMNRIKRNKTIWYWEAKVSDLRKEVDGWVGDAATASGGIASIAQLLGYATVGGVSVGTLGAGSSIVGLIAWIDRIAQQGNMIRIDLYSQEMRQETTDRKIWVLVERFAE